MNSSVIEVYLGDEDEISTDSYSDECLNPNCTKGMAIIGVCVNCANSGYNPRKHGVDA